MPEPLLSIEEHEKFLKHLKDEYGIESKPLTAPTGKIFTLKPRWLETPVDDVLEENLANERKQNERN